MANYLNKYSNIAEYTADTAAREALGLTVSVIEGEASPLYEGKKNPLGLPAFTIRCKFTSGYTPIIGNRSVCVDSAENIWDITKNSPDWRGLFVQNTDLIEVIAANTTGVTNMNMLFGETNITSVPLFDTSSVTTADLMFYNTNISTLPRFDFSSLVSAYSMFSQCNRLVTVPNFDLSNLEDGGYMFVECTSLQFIPPFVLSSLQNGDYMFGHCYSVFTGAYALYDQLLKQGLAHHQEMFDDCGMFMATGLEELNRIDIDWGGNYDPLNPLGLDQYTLRMRFNEPVTEDVVRSSMYLRGAEQVDEEGYIYDVKVSSSYYRNWGKLWKSGYTLNKKLVEVIGANTLSSERKSPVTNMQGLFNKCTNLTRVGFMFTDNVTSMSGMFGGCTSLTDISEGFSTVSCTNMSFMFDGCTSLTTISVDLGLDSCTNMSYMFRGCTNIQSGALALYQRASALGTITTHTDTFKNCGSETETGLAELNQISEDWGGNYDPWNPLNLSAKTLRLRLSRAVDTSSNGTFNYKYITLSTVDASNYIYDVTLKSGTTFESSKLWNQRSPSTKKSYLVEIIGGNTKGITIFSQTFSGCTNLINVPLLRTDRSTNVGGMFNGCTKVQSGALALYRQMANQDTPPTTYGGCFTDCGSETGTGSAELAQIPPSWGGTRT